MPGATTPVRVAFTVAVVVVAGLVGLLAGRASGGDDEGETELVVDRTAVAEPAPERSLLRELEALGQTRTVKLERIREAATPRAQASAGRSLAAAYRQTATAVAEPERLAALAPGGESIADALRGAAAAYGQLATGAASGDRSEYDAARRAVRRAELLLTRRVEANLDAGGNR